MAYGDNQANLSLSFQDLFRSYEAMLGIVRSIETFTRQTELLSLNSAVEAARAGDAGKGFKVISSEIKELALKSSESNKKKRRAARRHKDEGQRGVCRQDGGYRVRHDRQNRPEPLRAQLRRTGVGDV